MRTIPAILLSSALSLSVLPAHSEERPPEILWDHVYASRVTTFPDRPQMSVEIHFKHYLPHSPDRLVMMEYFICDPELKERIEELAVELPYVPSLIDGYINQFIQGPFEETKDTPPDLLREIFETYNPPVFRWWIPTEYDKGTDGLDWIIKGHSLKQKPPPCYDRTSQLKEM